jgi:hypothetical protein
MMRKEIKKKLILTFLYIAIFSIFVISSPEYNAVFSDDEPEKPYVSLLSVKYRAGIITIYFEPLLNVNLRYRIYRSQSLIKDDASLIEATLVSEVSKYELPFNDTPGIEGKYNYLITIVEKDIEHVTFIPFQNMNINPIDYSPFPQMVENIEIKPGSEEKVEISFKPINPNSTYFLYRSNEIIKEIAQQEFIEKPDQALSKKPNQELIGTIKGEAGHFTITLEEHIPHFFAITVKNRLDVLNEIVFPDRNMTDEPYFFEKTGETTAGAITVTNQELIDDNLKNNFYKSDYLKTLNGFIPILKKENLTAAQTAVIHFYMGQCQYYLGNYKEAIKHFIISKEVNQYKNMAEIWIDRSLAKSRG